MAHVNSANVSRRCNNEVEKVLPLLFAKHFYSAHKATVGTPPKHTVHLIVDEAHNILSEQSPRESESWKDCRLELFEEVIKEGRKFGMFVTIASQRPADISPTIVFASAQLLHPSPGERQRPLSRRQHNLDT
jgi:DNA helicase HerA-like ATPase